MSHALCLPSSSSQSAFSQNLFKTWLIRSSLALQISPRDLELKIKHRIHHNLQLCVCSISRKPREVVGHCAFLTLFCSSMRILRFLSSMSCASTGIWRLFLAASLCARLTDLDDPSEASSVVRCDLLSGLLLIRWLLASVEGTGECKAGVAKNSSSRLGLFGFAWDLLVWGSAGFTTAACILQAMQWAQKHPAGDWETLWSCINRYGRDCLGRLKSLLIDKLCF